MSIAHSQGLSQADLRSLLAELHASAQASTGAEMCYELVQCAAEFITARHSNMERGKQTSLEEVRRQRAKEEAQVSSKCEGEATIAS